MLTFSAIEGVELTIAATGTILLPSNANFDDGTQYEVFTIEGGGSVDDGSKTATQFAYTLVVGLGPCRVIIWTRLPGKLMSHVD